MTARCVSTRFGRVLVNPGRISRPSEATNPSANFHPSLEEFQHFQFYQNRTEKSVEASVVTSLYLNADGLMLLRARA